MPRPTGFPIFFREEFVSTQPEFLLSLCGLPEGTGRSSEWSIDEDRRGLWITRRVGARDSPEVTPIPTTFIPFRHDSLHVSSAQRYLPPHPLAPGGATLNLHKGVDRFF